MISNGSSIGRKGNEKKKNAQKYQSMETDERRTLPCSEVSDHFSIEFRSAIRLNVIANTFDSNQPGKHSIDSK